MTEHKIVLWLQYAAAVALTLFITLGILTSNQNLLGTVILFFIPFIVILGLSSPRMGIIFLLFVSAYIENYKRLTSLATDQSMLDVIIILALPPALLASIVGGIVGRMILGKLKLSRSAITIFFLCFVLAGSVFLALKIGGSTMSALRFTVNGTLYTFLIFAIPVLFPRYRDAGLLLGLLLGLYGTVALYGFWQWYFGFAKFEMDYILSGQTGLITNYFQNDLRIFSTLASHGSYGFAMSTCSVFCLAAWLGRRRLFGPTLYSHLLLPLSVIFLSAGLLSLVRASYLVVPFALGCYIMFRRVWTTVLVYVMGISGFLFVVANATYIVRNLMDWQRMMNNYVGGSSRLLTIGTFTPRLHSYNRLHDPAIYTFFGMDHPKAGHDNLTNFIVFFGMVPTVGIAIVLCTVLYYMHRTFLEIEDMAIRNMATMLLSLFLALLGLGIIFGGTTYVFPVNLLWWFSVAIIVVLIQEYRRLEQEKQTQVSQVEPEAAATVSR